MAKILIIGDILLDKYLECTAKGLSPEAPIVTFKVDRTKVTLGGAGNVLLNLKAFSDFTNHGIEPVFVGPVGDTARYLLDVHKIKFIPITDSYYTETCEKNRIVTTAPYQQIVRFDKDSQFIYSFEDMENLKQILENEGPFELCLISDYMHGAIRKEVIELIHPICSTIIADPKQPTASFYHGVDIITPNLAEFTAMMGQGDTKTLMKELSNKLWLDGRNVILKRGSQGCIVYSAEDQTFTEIPAYRTEAPVIDPTGAGDTFIATLTFANAAGLGLIRSAELANRMAGIAVTKAGCFVPTKEEIRKIEF